MHCLFCQIANGDIPATILYRDEKVIAFQDINPQAPHHYLVIPHKHIATLNDLNSDDNEMIGHLIKTGAMLAKQLNIAAEGYRLVFNCNEGAGQSVFHIHAHLLGGRRLTWPPG